MKITLLALHLLFAVALGGNAADTYQFTAALTASNGAPSVGTVTLLLTGNHLAYTGVDAPFPLVIRGPASPGNTGPIIATLQEYCGEAGGCDYYGERSLSAAEVAALQGGLWYAESAGSYRGQLLLECVSRYAVTNAVEFGSVLTGHNPAPGPRFTRWGRATGGLTGNSFSYHIRLPTAYGPYKGFIFDPSPPPGASARLILFLGTLECEPSLTPPPLDASSVEMLPHCVVESSFCVPDSLRNFLLMGEVQFMLFPADTIITRGNPVLGDILPLDSDLDGVPDYRDSCPNTAEGAVNSEGCSIEQLCPCAGPWKNHGEFVNCMKRVTAEFLSAGLITEAQRRTLLNRAARSDCGKR